MRKPPTPPIDRDPQRQPSAAVRRKQRSKAPTFPPCSSPCRKTTAESHECSKRMPHVRSATARRATVEAHFTYHRGEAHETKAKKCSSAREVTTCWSSFSLAKDVRVERSVRLSPFLRWRRACERGHLKQDLIDEWTIGASLAANSHELSRTWWIPEVSQSIHCTQRAITTFFCFSISLRTRNLVQLWCLHSMNSLLFCRRRQTTFSTRAVYRPAFS